MSTYINNSSSSKGIGFCGLLAIVFIVLRIIGVIDWSWWWVLAPIWIPTAIAIFVLACMFITWLIVKRKEK